MPQQTLPGLLPQRWARPESSSDRGRQIKRCCRDRGQTWNSGNAEMEYRPVGEVDQFVLLRYAHSLWNRRGRCHIAIAVVGGGNDRRHLRPREYRRQRPQRGGRARRSDRSTARRRMRRRRAGPSTRAISSSTRTRPALSGNSALASTRCLPPSSPARCSDVVIVSELSRIGRDTVRTPAAVLRRSKRPASRFAPYLSDAPISLADEAGELHTIFNSLAASFERRRARSGSWRRSASAEAGAVTGGAGVRLSQRAQRHRHYVLSGRSTTRKRPSCA